jgi:hypothetical protein
MRDFPLLAFAHLGMPAHWLVRTIKKKAMRRIAMSSNSGRMLDRCSCSMASPGRIHHDALLRSHFGFLETLRGSRNTLSKSDLVELSLTKDTQRGTE